MPWDAVADLPTRKDFLEMMTRARIVITEAITTAEQAGNHSLALRYQVELVNWDRLIGRMRAH
jgi:hypothetical protein